jgi:uncharacterized membrane protein YqiK
VPSQLIVLIVAIATVLVFAIVFLVIRSRLIRTVPPGHALLITSSSAGPRVTFTSALVLPGIHHATFVDITVKLLKVERAKTNPLLSRDEQRFRGVFTFYLRISRSEDGVMHATQSFGEKPLDAARLRECFLPKFDEALDTVAAMMTAEQLLQSRQAFKDEVLKVIGTDLNGLSLDDMAIDELVRLER